ncbi:unnamed protein product [Oikopleura dioica]|uniref:Uncharacterized protein n=1 Tax=Oikopleura dioica TaxID=34765 RepID=E4XQ30_OIKDI|nr:unnamed protein product [Oikopleura dioica]
MSKAVVDENFWHSFQMTEEDFKMRYAVSPHHTNPRSATLDFWRKTTPYNQYRILQDKRRKQMNQPTSSSHNKEEHMIIAQALASMEKRRVGTRFLDREVTQDDQEKPLMVLLEEKCSIM